MEKQMTLNAPMAMTAHAARAAQKVKENVKLLFGQFDKSMRLLSNYYASVLGREVDNRLLYALLGAQLSFFVGITPADYPLLLRALMLLLTALSVRRCHRLLQQ